MRYGFNWQASEASETLSGLFNRESRYIYIYLGMYVCHIFSLTFSASTSETLSVLFNREYPTGGGAHYARGLKGMSVYSS